MHNGPKVFGSLLVVLTVIGCGPDYGKKQSVMGNVKLKGQPLDHGKIQFSPKVGTNGSMSGADIKDGRYEISRADGLNPGIYEVRLTSPEAPPVTETEAPGVAGPPAKDRIPSDFNVQTKLEFEVKENSPNEFHVDIP